MPPLRSHEDTYEKYADSHQWFPVPFFCPPSKKFDLRDFCITDYDKFSDDVCSVVTVEAPETKTVDRTLEERFRKEADRWDRETAYLSSTPKMILHDSYQTIMAMGPDVVPHLLRDLQQNRRSWFWALRHLTRANPVLPEDQGNLDKMIAAWVAWGKREDKI